jgi:hypothetical protein
MTFGAPSPPQISSDWPLVFLLDELWLSSRRSLVHALEHAKVWPSSTHFNAFVTEQADLGRTLGNRVLQPILGEDDYRVFIGGRLFGTAGADIHRRYPMVLAFGFSMTSGLYKMAGAGGRRCDDAASLGGLFNLGISLMDTLCDSVPESSGALRKTLDADMLQRMTRDGPKEIRGIVDGIADDDMRVVMKIVCGFFDRLPRSNRQYSNRLVVMEKELLAAYSAELSSTDASRSSTGRCEEMVRISERKSMAPFRVISEVVRLHLPTRNESDWRDRIRRAARYLGRIFWHVDDLVDVVNDCRWAAVNSVLARSGVDVRWGPEAAKVYPRIKELLESRTLKRHAQLTITELQKLKKIRRASRLSLNVGNFVRAWIDS